MIPNWSKEPTHISGEPHVVTEDRQRTFRLINEINSGLTEVVSGVSKILVAVISLCASTELPEEY